MTSQKLSLVSYTRRNIPARICELTMEGYQCKRVCFYNGVPQDLERYAIGRVVDVEFDLSKFDNGIYESQECYNVNLYKKYFKLESGKIIREWETMREMLDEVNPLPELTRLKGNTEQILWAESIRYRAIRHGFPIDEAMMIDSAKVWIDKRDDLIS